MDDESRVPAWWERYKDNIVSLVELCLVAAVFFGLGMLFAQRSAQRHPVVITTAASSYAAATSSPTALTAAVQSLPQRQTAGAYVASKSGKTYYLTTCNNTIKETNKIYFATAEDAEKAGYVPSKTCFK
ncbi:MAG: Ada metal-binding domain-containing protein [Patescibacteria group bacterium]